MNFRDVEQLSTYLDGQLSPSDLTRLEARLKTDPELASALDALRESRTLLRRLPHRRAPRNFLLTPKMVGRKPPLPRSYPIFRLATVVATLLFGLSFLTSQIASFGAAAPAPSAYGLGGGGETAATAAPTEPPMIQMAPAATQPPAPEATMEPAGIAPTATPESTADQNRAAQEAASPKSTEAPAPTPRPLLSAWQIGFGLVALLGAASMLLTRRLAARKWRAK